MWRTAESSEKGPSACREPVHSPKADVSPENSGTQQNGAIVSTYIPTFSFFYYCRTVSQKRKKEMKEKVLNFFSLSPRKLLFNTGVHWALIMESGQKAMRYSSNVTKEQESKIQQIRVALCSAFHLKNFHSSGLHWDVCFLFGGPLP